MAPKRNSASHSSSNSTSTPSPAAVPPTTSAASAKPSTAASGQSHTTSSTKPSVSTPTKSSFSSSKSRSQEGQGVQDIVLNMWDRYDRETPQRTKLVDAFMGFLVVVGVLQFVYCVLVGTYPFNAFLSGFSATVGQFVLTASLRMQTNAANKKSLASDGFVQSDERAFADFVLGSLLLHFFCVNFLN